MTGTARGRLPSRVYWVRRLMVLGIAVLLVVGIARMLGSGGGGSGAPDRVTPVADTSSQTDGAGHHGRRHHHHKAPSTPPSTPAAMPSGPCADDDVAITPSVPTPIAGSDIDLVLDISTVASPACDWTLSGRTLALKITSGSDLIWTTVQCARVIPTQNLVLRNTAPTRVKITWNARRSEPGCPRVSDWAKLGTYHLHVAALAGQPQDVTFTLVAPEPAEITRTEKPTPHHHSRRAHHRAHHRAQHRHRHHHRRRSVVD